MKKSFCLEERAPLVVEPQRVGLQRVADLLARAERLLQLDDTAEEVDAEQGRLAAVPDELDHRGRLRLDVLLDVVREHFVRHLEVLAAGYSSRFSR